MDQVHREIVTKYRVDGIFVNWWANQTDCYCASCQLFTAATGLPPADDRRERRGPRAHRVAEGAADGTLEALGRYNPRGQPGAA
jgi:hypothetical protein